MKSRTDSDEDIKVATSDNLIDGKIQSRQIQLVTEQRIDEDNPPIKSELINLGSNYEKLAKQYCSELPKRLDELTAIVENEDWERASLQAHNLKGVSGNMGYPTIHANFQAIEKNIKKQDKAAIKSNLADIEKLAASAQLYFDIQTGNHLNIKSQ